MIYAIPPVFVILWLIGGQINKAARRYALPGLAAAMAVGGQLLKDKKRWWLGLVVLLYIPILSIGYGVDSIFGRVFKREWAIRLAYAIVCCVPMLTITIFTQQWWKLAISTLAVLGAFQVRAGTLFRIGGYDVLIEDLVRSFVLGSAVAWSLA